MSAGTWSLAPRIRPYARAFFAWLDAGHVPYVITSTRRSRNTQGRLYGDYLQGRSRYPAAPPGHSLHEKGLAFDLDVPGHREWLPYLGRAWESFGRGFTWGGRFGDPVHFDLRS